MTQLNHSNRASRVVIPRPERMRRIGSLGFGWVDARLFKDHWLELMTPEEIAAYLFLCLVANQQGISWYRRDRICAALNLPQAQGYEALDRLCQLDLVAYLPFGRYDTEGFRQVLSVPCAGPFAQPARPGLVVPPAPPSPEGLGQAPLETRSEPSLQADFLEQFAKRMGF